MRRHGLIVGINRYHSLPGLNKPAADAESIAQVLEKFGEFKITRLPERIARDGRLEIDPSQELTTARLKRAIAQLLRPGDRDYPDLALLFFAGHGVRESIGLHEAYLAASDCAPAAELWGVSLAWLQRLLSESPVRSQVVWLDCCHSGVLLNLSAADPGGINRGFIAASRSFEAAYEQTAGGHGVLTSALLKGLDPTLQQDGRVTHFSLADTVNRRLLTETQHPVCNNSGEPIVLTRTVTRRDPVAVRAQVCPYKGLEFFDCNDSDPEFFYGRDRLVDQIVERIRKDNFAAITGISGSGKSSLVRAGFLHQLKRGQRLAGSDAWRLVVMLPGERPLDSLVEALRSQTDIAVGDLGDLLSSAASESLAGIASSVAGDGRLVLVVDQFEEVFTRCRDESSREQFFSCLLGALDKAGDRLTVVITLRADFFSKCAERPYGGLAARVQRGLVTVLPMDASELRQAIVEPARKVGLAIDDDVVAEIIAAVHHEPGDLPLLEYSLTELWDRCHRTGRLAREEYLQLGGVQGALERRAEAVYRALTPAEGEAAKWIFIELTQLGEGTEDTRRRLAKSALLASQRSPMVTESTLEKLTEARLLVTGKGQYRQQASARQPDVVDVAHESLIRGWPRLRRWIDENRAFQRWRLRLREAASEWVANRDRGLLLRGARLLEAEAQLGEHPDALSRIETDFIAASTDQQQEEEQARKDQLKALDEQRNRALRMQSLFLSDLARQQTERHDYCLGLLLALEALPEQLPQGSRPFIPQAYRELYASAVNLQRVRVLRGPNAGAIDAAFSPDGRCLVTTYNDGSAIVWDSSTGRSRTHLQGHRGGVSRAVFCPNGKRLATTSLDGTARLWSTDDWELVATLALHAFSITACAFSPDGLLLVTASSDGTARLWDARAGASSCLLEGHEGPIFSTAFSLDGQAVATGSKDCTVRLWDPRGGDARAILKGHEDSVFAVAFNPGGRYLASASGDGTARLWDMQRSEAVQVFRGHREAVNTVACSPNGARLVTASQDGTARLWEVGLRKSVAVLSGHEGSIVDAMFSPDGRLLVTAGQDGETRLWEAGRGEMLAVLTGAKDRINAVAFDPEGSRLGSVSQDGSGRIWSIRERERLEIIWGHQSGVYSVVYSPDGRWIATGSEDRTARIWDAVSGAELTTFGGHDSSVYGVAFSPDGRHLATASRDARAAIWDAWSGERLAVLKGHKASVFTVAFSPDGSLVVTASADGTARIWDVNRGAQLAALGGHHGGVNAAVFAPDGASVATVSLEGKVRIWKSGHDSDCSILNAHHSGVNAAAFSPNGRWLATASNDGTTKLWDLRQRRTLAVLRGHGGVVYSVAFSPDGQRLVTASRDQTARVWDTNLGEELRTLAGHADSVNAAQFSPDGTRVVTASDDRSVRIWRALPAGQKLLDHALRLAPRELTPEERRRFFIE